jgi:hypothetical protein
VPTEVATAGKPINVPFTGPLITDHVSVWPESRSVIAICELMEKEVPIHGVTDCPLPYSKEGVLVNWIAFLIL